MNKNTSAPRKNEVNKTERNSFSSITSGAPISNFLNYKPKRERDQDFDSYRDRRGNGPNTHRGIDYGSGLGITKNTNVLSVLNGVATPISNYYKQNGVTDSGVTVTGKDSQNRTVEITYGHLSAESVKEIFNGKNSISVNAGDKLGKVGSTGKAARNEYHVHVKVEVNGKVVNPIEYFQQEYKAQKNNENTMPKQKEGSHESDHGSKTTNLHSDNHHVAKGSSIAMQRYQAIADILEKAGLQPGSSDWNKSVVQTAMGTDLDILDVENIVKSIPGIEPNEAQNLVNGVTKDTQMTFA